jgi:hypothetical protein
VKEEEEEEEEDVRTPATPDVALVWTGADAKLAEASCGRDLAADDA